MVGVSAVPAFVQPSSTTSGESSIGGWPDLGLGGLVIDKDTLDGESQVPFPVPLRPSDAAVDKAPAEGELPDEPPTAALSEGAAYLPQFSGALLLGCCAPLDRSFAAPESPFPSAELAPQPITQYDKTTLTSSHQTTKKWKTVETCGSV